MKKGEDKVKELKRKPRLVDVLLDESIKVYEPLWTCITGNKAILPILHQLYPESPYLLNSAFELTPELVKTGYVSKPLIGYTGKNVSIYAAGSRLVEETQGKWENEAKIYQEYR